MRSVRGALLTWWQTSVGGIFKTPPQQGMLQTVSFSGGWGLGLRWHPAELDSNER